MSRVILYLGISLLLSACMGTEPPAISHPLATAMPEGNAVPAPSGYLAYCERAPKDCAVPVSDHFEQTLRKLLTSVQQTVVPTPEKGDYWQRLTSAGPGDCEDFALTLRYQLKQAFPEYSSAFLLATAYTETNTYHAVLSIETNAGTLVCDIRYAQCGPWENFPYQWRLREVANASHWEEIGPVIITQILTAAT